MAGYDYRDDYTPNEGLTWDSFGKLNKKLTAKSKIFAPEGYKPEEELQDAQPQTLSFREKTPPPPVSKPEPADNYGEPLAASHQPTGKTAETPTMQRPDPNHIIWNAPGKNEPRGPLPFSTDKTPFENINLVGTSKGDVVRPAAMRYDNQRQREEVDPSTLQVPKLGPSPRENSGVGYSVDQNSGNIATFGTGQETQYFNRFGEPITDEQYTKEKRSFLNSQGGGRDNSAGQQARRQLYRANMNGDGTVADSQMTPGGLSIEFAKDTPQDERVRLMSSLENSTNNPNAFRGYRTGAQDFSPGQADTMRFYRGRDLAQQDAENMSGGQRLSNRARREMMLKGMDNENSLRITGMNNEQSALDRRARMAVSGNTLGNEQERLALDQRKLNAEIPVQQAQAGMYNAQAEQHGMATDQAKKLASLQEEYVNPATSPERMKQLEKVLGNKQPKYQIVEKQSAGPGGEIIKTPFLVDQEGNVREVSGGGASDEPLPANIKDRIKGKTYSSQYGSGVWDGEKFVRK